MKIIKLGGKRGGETIVDDDDYEWLNKYGWFLSSDGYPKRTFRINKKLRGVQMHFNIMYKDDPSFPFVNKNGKMIDHINRIKTDNRKENLRFCTLAINALNCKLKSSNTTGYTGIKKDKYGRWYTIVRHSVNGKTKHEYAGLFDTPEKAALAYNAITFSIYKDYTILNKISGLPNAQLIVMPEKLPYKIKCKPNKNFANGYRGIRKHNKYRWSAVFYHKSKDVVIRLSKGGFETPEDAARAYNALNYSVLHDYKLLNIIPGLSKEESIIMPPQLPKSKNRK